MSEFVRASTNQESEVGGGGEQTARFCCFHETEQDIDIQFIKNVIVEMF